MPRLARAVFPTIPHHITQRGNRCEDVFFSDEDRFFYLELLQHYSKKYNEQKNGVRSLILQQEERPDPVFLLHV